MSKNNGQQVESDSPFADADIISTYTRQQAIEDGVLVDLTGAHNPETQRLVREAGFRLPVAMTATAFAAAVAPLGDDDGQLPPGQSLTGRLWDVLMVCRAAMRKALDTDRCHFAVSVDRGGGQRETVALWALCGPGDQAEPVVTIMLEGED